VDARGGAFDKPPNPRPALRERPHRGRSVEISPASAAGHWQAGRAPPQNDLTENRPARGYIAFAAIAGPAPQPGAKASAPLLSLHAGRKSCLAPLVFLRQQDRTIARTPRAPRLSRLDPASARIPFRACFHCLRVAVA